jgi:hypothetical protein
MFIFFEGNNGTNHMVEDKKYYHIHKFIFSGNKIKLYQTPRYV